ncbi:helix-turn-helix domain-containing protein [Pseudomonas sp. RTB2]|uniref:helix-turn-helix domain-containing protein n=1 Tax=unclassified Pseudomonas TaxID=196821 RepID=UPI0034DCC6A7
MGKYSKQFKLSVLQPMWREKLSFRQTAVVFNLGNSTQVGRWQQRYYSGGPARAEEKLNVVSGIS